MTEEWRKWRTDKWNFPLYRSSEPVLAQLELADLPITVANLTLREGDQTVLTPSFGPVQNRIALAERLDDIGVKMIQIKDTDLKPIADLELKAKIEVLNIFGYRGAKKEDVWQSIERQIDDGADRIKLIEVRSKPQWKKTFGDLTEQQVIDAAVQNVDYLKGRGVEVSIDTLDANRADINFLKELGAAVAEAGADAMRLNDTLGIGTPTTVKYMVREFKNAVRKISTRMQIGFHAHNDYGLAVANSLAAVEAGADLIDTTCNGIGPRAGNCPMEVLVPALEVFYNLRTGITLEKLTGLSRFVSDLTNVPISPTAPIVGDLVFTDPSHDDDIDLDAMEPLLPEVVGNERRWVITGMAGPNTYKAWLKQHGIHLNDGQLNKLIKKASDETLLRNKTLRDEDILEIAKNLIG